MQKNVFSRRTLWLPVLLAAVFLGMIYPVYAQESQPGDRIQQGAVFLASNNIPPEAFREVSAYAYDPQKLAETLIKYGYTPEQAQAFMTPQNVMALRNAVNPGPSDALINQALVIFAPYNLSMSDLNTLLPLVNDPQSMMAALTQKGLSSEQAMQLLQQAGPLIQEASASGLLQYALINEQLSAMVTQAGFDMTILYEVSTLLNDPEALAAYLAEKGYDEQQIQNFQGVVGAMATQGITQDMLEGWQVKNLVYRLEGMGLSPETINDVVALGDMDAVREYLTGQGFSGDVLELALTNIGGCMGDSGEMLSPEKLAEFQEREAIALLGGAGVDPEDLGNILALDDDPEALGAYLAETYGLDQTQIDAFVNGLSRSTFAQTVAPEDAEEFIANVEGAIEENQEQGGDYAGDESGGDAAGVDESGGDAAGGDGSGGDAGSADDGSGGDAGGGDS